VTIIWTIPLAAKESDKSLLSLFRVSLLIAILVSVLFLGEKLIIYESGATAEIYGQPRIDEVYMKVMTSPDEQVSAFQACEVDFLPDMLSWSYVQELLDENQSVLVSPAFHYCYIAFNCRDYVPDDAGQPDSGRSLAPLNWSSFRQALAWAGLSHAEKEAVITEILGPHSVTAVDSPVPPALGVWHREPTLYPGGNYTKAWELLQASGFYKDGTLLMQPNFVPVKDQIHILDPTISPTDSTFIGKWVHKWNDFFDNYLSVSNCNFVQTYTTISDLITRAFYYRNFDGYALCWGLDDFPDYLYDIFHSSQDYPDGYNSPGVKDPELDELVETIKYGTVYEEMLQACYEAQDKLVFDLCPCVYWYSRTYHDFFKNCTYYTGEPKWLTGMINMKGYGADNMWTWGLMHWNTASVGGTVNCVLSGAPTNLRPGWADSSYEWDVLNKIEDNLIGMDQELLDIPWIACNWSAEHLFLDPPGINVTKVRFKIREGVLWHDRKSVTVDDVKFALEYLRNFPPYEALSQNLLWSQIIDPHTIDIYLNTSSYDVLHDLASVALKFPKHIYDRPDSINANLWEVPYEAWTGQPPPAEYPFMKALIGCGPFVFDYWNSTAKIVHLVKFQDYWVNSPLKAGVIAPGKVDPDTSFAYYVDVMNAVSVDEVTGEPVPSTIDKIDIYFDGVPYDTILGPITVDKFAHVTLGPFAHTGLSGGLHVLSCKVWVNGEVYDEYAHHISVTFREDLNYDLIVNYQDAIILGEAFGSNCGDARWDERADIILDQVINFRDAIKLGAVFGESA
jgi:peptide/nickel transport system substrate-binding protein